MRLNSYNRGTIYINTTTERPFSFIETDTMDAVDVGVVSEVTVLAKIIGIGSININYYCVMCNTKFTANADQDEYQCSKESCKGFMLLANCRTTCTLSLIISDIENDSRSTLFFNMDKVMMLKNIINFPFLENKIAKSILRFPDILQITFDFVSKSVLNVLKV